jgi:transposase
VVVVDKETGVEVLVSPVTVPGPNGGVGSGEAARRRVPSAGGPEKPKRRSFTAAYKVRIVEEAEACTQPGEIGALLRREGLYSSHLVDWRREYRAGAAERLAQRHRGPKGQSPLLRQKEELEQQVARLQERLRQAELIIGVQKNLRAPWAPPVAPETPGRLWLL